MKKLLPHSFGCKHIFSEPTYPEPYRAPKWLGRRCRFCGKISGLDDWQIVDMPVSMARCKSSTVKIGFIERITGAVNCLDGKEAPDVRT